MVDITTETKVLTCAKCRTEFRSQTLVLFGVEIFRERQALCNRCADAVNAQHEQEQARTRRTELQRQWERICPSSYRDTDPAKLPCKRRMDEILAWRYGRDGLLAHGKTGLGKTRCLYLLLQRLHFEEHRRIKTINGPDFASKCSRYSWEDQAKSDSFIEELCRVELLMIDDLDKARFSDRPETGLWQVIENRVSNEKPILTSLNVTGDELAAMFSEHRGLALVRRLRDFCRVVDFDQP
jgi:DNA replication protein DnaC